MHIKTTLCNWQYRALLHGSLIAALGLGLNACSSDADGSRSRRGDALIPAVEAVQSRVGALPLTERLTGVVRAKNQVEIYPQISAVIDAVEANDGTVVRKGQPLVRLRDKELRERLRQARASSRIAAAQAKQADARLDEIRAELNRTEALAKKQLTSDSRAEAMRAQSIVAEADVELAQARLEQAKATVDEREEALAQTVIRAPTAGTVGNRNAEVGMLVSSSTRLFTIGRLDSVQVDVILTDRMLDYLEEGQRTEILPGDGAVPATSAPLSRISPFLHPVTHTTSAEIDLGNPDNRLKPGMFVSVDVFYGESEQATLVPLAALYENPITGGTGVYVSRELANREGTDGAGSNAAPALTAPVPFEFIPVDVVAKGRMQAGIRGIDPDTWVITLGQDLLGGEPGEARVRQTNWNWVEQLQTLQRTDLMQELMQRRSGANPDSAAVTHKP